MPELRTRTDPQVLTTAEVAATLRMSPRWFRATRRRLQAAGFPAPIAGIPRPYRWSSAAVRQWLENQTVKGSEEARDERLDERASTIAANMGRRRRQTKGSSAARGA